MYIHMYIYTSMYVYIYILEVEWCVYENRDVGATTINARFESD